MVQVFVPRQLLQMCKYCLRDRLKLRQQTTPGNAFET